MVGENSKGERTLVEGQRVLRVQNEWLGIRNLEGLVTRRLRDQETPASLFRAKREIFAIRGEGLTVSPYVPRTSLLSSSVFHTACALSASSGHLPLEGKDTIRDYPLLKRRRSRHPVRLPAPPYRHPERRETPYVRKTPARTSGD